MNQQNNVIHNLVVSIWESKNKLPFHCAPHHHVHNALLGGNWWFLPSLGHNESCEKCVFYDLVHAPLWFEFAFFLFFLGLCKSISFWIQTREFMLISFLLCFCFLNFTNIKLLHSHPFSLASTLMFQL